MSNANSTSTAPIPRFTMEELLREAVEAVPTDGRCIFTTRELAKLWGYTTQNSARRQMDLLTDKGWKFPATRKSILTRTGDLTSTHAYAVVPPESGNGETTSGGTA